MAKTAPENESAELLKSIRSQHRNIEKEYAEIKKLKTQIRGYLRATEKQVKTYEEELETIGPRVQSWKEIPDPPTAEEMEAHLAGGSEAWRTLVEETETSKGELLESIERVKGEAKALASLLDEGRQTLEKLVMTREHGDLEFERVRGLSSEYEKLGYLFEGVGDKKVKTELESRDATIRALQEKMGLLQSRQDIMAGDKIKWIGVVALAVAIFSLI